MKHQTAVIDLQYLPCLEYGKIIFQHEKILLESYEHYQKGSYRNRCHITTSQGLLSLSVPLQRGKHEQQPIRAVRIANETAWQRLHWRSLEAGYANAPFWEHYAPDLEKFYLKKYDFLWDFNWELWQQMAKWLKISTQNITFTSEWYDKKLLTEGGIADYRGKISPKNEAQTCLPYTQVFADKHVFLPNLSMIDLLFCSGAKILSSYLKH